MILSIVFAIVYALISNCVLQLMACRMEAAQNQNQ